MSIAGWSTSQSLTLGPTWTEWGWCMSYYMKILLSNVPRNFVIILSFTFCTYCITLWQENTQSKQSRSQEHLAGKRKIRSSEFSLQSSGPAQQLSDCRLSSVSSSSQVPSQQRQLWGDNSSRYLHAYIPYQHQEYGHPSHQFSVTRTGSSIKSETKNHPLNYKVSGRHASNNVPSMEISSNHLAKFSTAITEEKVIMLDHPQ